MQCTALIVPFYTGSGTHVDLYDNTVSVIHNVQITFTADTHQLKLQ